MSSAIAFFSLCLLVVQALEQPLRLEPEQTKILKNEHNDLIRDVKGILLNSVNTMKAGVEEQVTGFKSFLETSQKEAEDRINEKYELSRQHIRSLDAPKVCRTEADNMLLVAKTNTIHSFKSCTSNLTGAGKDILYILEDIGIIGTQMLIPASTILNGMNDCFSWNPIHVVICTYKWVRRVITEVSDTFKVMYKYTNNVRDLIVDITDQIEYCFHQSHQTHNSDSQKSFTQFHVCTSNSYDLN